MNDLIGELQVRGLSQTTGQPILVYSQYDAIPFGDGKNLRVLAVSRVCDRYSTLIQVWKSNDLYHIHVMTGKINTIQDSASYWINSLPISAIAEIVLDIVDNGVPNKVYDSLRGLA